MIDSNGTAISAIRPLEAVAPKRNASDSFSANSPPAWKNQDDDVSSADNPAGRELSNNHGKLKQETGGTLAAYCPGGGEG